MQQDRRPLTDFTPDWIDFRHHLNLEDGSRQWPPGTHKAVVQLFAHLAERYRNAPPEGKDGYRAQYVLVLAASYRHKTADEVDDTFLRYLGPHSYKAVLKACGIPERRPRGRPRKVRLFDLNLDAQAFGLLRREALASLSRRGRRGRRGGLEGWRGQKLYGPVGSYRQRTGRPPTGEVARRTWAVDALCHKNVCGLSLHQAIVLWNGAFPEAPYRSTAKTATAAKEDIQRRFRRDREQLRARIDPLAVLKLR